MRSLVHYLYIFLGSISMLAILYRILETATKEWGTILERRVRVRVEGCKFLESHRFLNSWQPPRNPSLTKSTICFEIYFKNLIIEWLTYISSKYKNSKLNSIHNSTPLNCSEEAIRLMQSSSGISLASVLSLCQTSCSWQCEPRHTQGCQVPPKKNEQFSDFLVSWFSSRTKMRPWTLI